MEKIKAKIIWHYSDITQRRSDKQEEQELKLLGLVPFHRMMMLPAAVLIQLCVGTVYGWSVNNIPIETYIGAPAGTAANTFYIAVGCFGPSAALFGPWLERHGPRASLILSSILFFLGNIFSAISVWRKSIIGLYFSYGVIGGFGLGLSYITPVSPLQKWFPDYRGLVSGLAVCGFGGGSMISSKAQHYLIEKYNVPLMFVILGSTYFVIMMLCTLILRTPPRNFTVANKPATFSNSNDLVGSENQTNLTVSPTNSVSKTIPAEEVHNNTAAIDVNDEVKCDLHEPTMQMSLIGSLRTNDYRIMYFMLVANVTAGLLTISKLSDICQLQFGENADLASTVVSVNSAFNLFGRFACGFLSDFVGRKPLFMLSLALQAIVVICAPTMIMTGTFWPFVVCMWLLSAFYGGGFGLIPAFLADMFGTKNIGSLHGIILTGYSLVGVVGGLTFSAIYKNQVAKYGDKGDVHVYNVNYYWISVVIWLGVIVTPFISVGAHDRLLPKIPGHIFRFRLGRRIFRASTINGFEYLTHQQEEDEWCTFLCTLPENQKNCSKKEST